MSEKRLIDAKPLMENGWHLVKTGESNRFLTSMSLADVPTVDAVEVVRCKDCKSYCHIIGKDDRAIFGCSYMGRDVKPDDFCSYGERRTDG